MYKYLKETKIKRTLNSSEKCTYIVCGVYTDGANNTLDLRREANELEEYCLSLGMNTLFVNYHELGNMIGIANYSNHDRNRLKSIIPPTMLPRGWREDWANVGFMQWKPIFLDIINREMRGDNTFIYIDVNTSKYPTYFDLLKNIQRYTSSLLRKKEILLFHDSLNHLCVHDIKQSVIKKYSQNIREQDLSLWAGLIIFKSGDKTTEFLEEWRALSSSLTNLLPTDRLIQSDEFIYHSQEQAMLTICFYKNKLTCNSFLLLGSRRFPAISGEIKYLLKDIPSIFQRRISPNRKAYILILIGKSLWYNFLKLINK